MTSLESDCAMREIKSAISYLKKRRTVGEDTIPAEAFISLTEWIAPEIIKTPNGAKEQGERPQRWQNGLVVFYIRTMPRKSR